MAELILPAVQLSAYAWHNIVTALRSHGDEHLMACAEAIEQQIGNLEKNFGAETCGEVSFNVTATLKAA